MMKDKKPALVGVIPAAGHASRISPLPCSKEILPVGFHENSSGETTVKVSVHDLLESFELVKAEQIFMIIRKGKWDIPQYLGERSHPDSTIAYIATGPTCGTHYTIDLAYHFIKNKIVLLGFPDILFEPKDAFVQLLAKQAKTDADVVLGLFKADSPQKADMVDFKSGGKVTDIVIKSKQTTLTYCWALACWTPRFTEYLHQYIAKKKDQKEDNQSEIFVGDVIRQAMCEGFNVNSVAFNDGSFVDIGTIAGLKKAIDKSL